MRSRLLSPFGALLLVGCETSMQPITRCTEKAQALAPEEHVYWIHCDPGQTLEVGSIAGQVIGMCYCQPPIDAGKR